MWTRKPKISTAYHWNIKAPFLRGMKKYNSMMPGQFGLVILLLYWHGVESSCEVVLMSLVHVKMDGTKTPILIIQEASWWNLRETKSSSYKGEIYIRKVIDLKKEPIRIWTITKTLVTKESTFSLMALQLPSFIFYFTTFILFYFIFVFFFSWQTRRPWLVRWMLIERSLGLLRFVLVLVSANFEATLKSNFFLFLRLKLVGCKVQ